MLEIVKNGRKSVHRVIDNTVIDKATRKYMINSEKFGV